MIQDQDIVSAGHQKTNAAFILVSIVYLFFNSFLLPDGLLYTTLLTPFFFLNLLKKGGMKLYFIFFLITVVFAIFQLPDVAFIKDYIISFVVLQCAAIFTLNAFYYLQEESRLNSVFKILATVNLFLLVLSILALLIPVVRSYFWYEMAMSEGLPLIPRLKMLTYEASYYSLIIMPVFSYYLLKKMLLNSRSGILLISLCVAMLLSLSFGVLAGMLISIVLVYCFNLNELGRKINLNYIFLTGIVMAIGLFVLYRYYPHNIFFERLRNISDGKDTSARGRTYESFDLAWGVAKMKSIWWGVGPGQLKHIGREYIIQYYTYSAIPPVIRIPNAVAETLNIYGIAGVCIRFAIIIYLFFKTKVWQNYYRLLLFIFIFIYQFTGSFLVNIAEYILWILAFSKNLFPEFNRQHFIKSKEA